MLRILTAVLLAAVLSACATAQPQAAPSLAPHVQRFLLHKPMTEPAITACKSSATLIAINEAFVMTAQAMFQAAVQAGECANGSAVVTYVRLVHRIDLPNGDVWTVYEARAAGTTFYVPMRGFLHAEVGA